MPFYLRRVIACFPEKDLFSKHNIIYRLNFVILARNLLLLQIVVFLFVDFGLVDVIVVVLL